MKNYKTIFSGFIGTVISFVGVGVSAETMDHIISIVCGVIGILINVIVLLLIPFIKWLKRAKEDGIITNEELDELSDTLKEGKNGLEKSSKNKEKGE